MPTTGSTAATNQLAPALHAIRNALAQVDPWDYGDKPTRAYVRGYNDANAFLEYVLTAVEHGLMCRCCGMPAHRGDAHRRLSELIPEWVKENRSGASEPSEHDEVERRGQVMAKLQTRIAALRRRNRRQYCRLKALGHRREQEQ